jgi:hypothetical protein
MLFLCMTIPPNCLLPQVFRNYILKISGNVKTNTNIAYAFIRTFKQTNKHTYMHACMRTYIHLHSRTHTHTRTRALAQIQYHLIWSSYTYTVHV